MRFLRLKIFIPMVVLSFNFPVFALKLETEPITSLATTNKNNYLKESEENDGKTTNKTVEEKKCNQGKIITMGFQNNLSKVQNEFAIRYIYELIKNKVSSNNSNVQSDSIKVIFGTNGTGQASLKISLNNEEAFKKYKKVRPEILASNIIDSRKNLKELSTTEEISEDKITAILDVIFGYLKKEKKKLKDAKIGKNPFENLFFSTSLFFNEDDLKEEEEVRKKLNEYEKREIEEYKRYLNSVKEDIKKHGRDHIYELLNNFIDSIQSLDDKGSFSSTEVSNAQTVVSNNLLR